MKMKETMRNSYLFASILTFLLGFIICVIVGFVLFFPGRQISISDEEKKIIERTGILLHIEDANEIWESEISRGQLSISDFVRNGLTGTQYLLQGKRDDAFSLDLSYIVYGNGNYADAIYEDCSGKSRNYVIESTLSALNSEYSPFLGYSDEFGTQLIDFEVDKPLQNDDGYVFGLRIISGEINMNGAEARTDFYVDDSLRPGEMKLYAGSSFGSSFSLTWDAREEIPGIHTVKVLLKTSDGRGAVMTGGQVIIPEFIALENDRVFPGYIPEGPNQIWYSLDAKEKNAYINFIDIQGSIEATLYDMNGRLIGTNDSSGTDNEVLRGLRETNLAGSSLQQQSLDAKNVFYARVQTSPNTEEFDGNQTFTVVTSKEVAISPEGELLAVTTDIGTTVDVNPGLSILGDEFDLDVVCINGSGEEVSYKKSALEFLPLNGFLTSLTMIDEKTQEVFEVYPTFDSSVFAYAYVSPQEVSGLELQYSGSEGYASKITVSNLTDNDISFRKGEEEGVQIHPASNVITIVVTDFDGEDREYTIYFLSGNDSAGYDTEVLSQFPASYHSGIWLLHNLRPEYRFIAYRPGIEWEDLVANQDSKGTSLANEGSHPQWVKPDSIVYDGTSWKAAETEVVEYFLDPRNFLNVVYVFQFEKLSFDESVHTVEGVRVMVEKSFLNDEDLDYANILYEAGKEANISPYFLASKIIQEMGRYGESKLATGTLEGYEGYYNFYNIGSTPNPSVTDGALINGARYAQWGRSPDEEELTEEEMLLLLPWTSPDLAIRGGARWIAASYVDIGQETLYFQKFDVIDNEDGLYIHQYAQNISMAYSEGARYFRAYLSQGMIDSSFLFIIPVYENMPLKFGTLP